MSEKAERLTLFLLVASFLLGIGLLQFKRQHPPFTLRVLSEEAPIPVPLRMVSLNSATEKEFERLPGIGPVLARRIVETRNRQGLFVNREGLLAVKGIGPRLFEQIAPYLEVE